MMWLLACWCGALFMTQEALAQHRKERHEKKWWGKGR